MAIWGERPHICQVSGVEIKEPLTLYFHHVLPKAKFPLYRFEKWNILLVSWEVHDRIERALHLVTDVYRLTKLMKAAHDDNALASMAEGINDPMKLYQLFKDSGLYDEVLKTQGND